MLGLLLGLLATLGPYLAEACHQVYFGPTSEQNIACECNATHCDSLQFEWPRRDEVYLRVTSTKAGDRFRICNLIATRERPDTPPDIELEVDAGARRQQVAGFGGAFTDSAALMLGPKGGLSAATLERAHADYFGPHGLDYSLGRVPISGTDMSWRPYSYDDLEPGRDDDLQLDQFRLQPEDLEHKIPLIKRANELRQTRAQPESPLKLMAASWSAPAWMKSNRNLVQGRLRGNSSGPYYQAYARYVVRFLDEYERLGVNMWALSPQNEPHTPTRVGPKIIDFNSLNFQPQEMADYLENCLVPALLDSNRTRDKLKLFIWDDTLDGLAQYQLAALAGPRMSQYASGVSLHWYAQGLRDMPYRLLHEARRRLPPAYQMISTEACFIGRPQPGEWQRGAKYARDIIENLRAGSIGWIDWNLALNTSGGPTWTDNWLDAPMLVEPERDRYLKSPMYYALGHVSRFVKADSHILASQVRADAGSSELVENVHLVAAELEQPAREPSQPLRRQISLVALNRNSGTVRARLKLLKCKLKESQPDLELVLPGSSLTSLAFTC